MSKEQSEIEKIECPNCKGYGYTVEPQHAYGCDGERCVVECPVQEQVKCDCFFHKVKYIKDKFHIIPKTDDPAKWVENKYGGDAIVKLKWQEDK